MRSESIVAGVIAVVGVSLFTILLAVGKIAGPTYTALLAILALVALVVHGFSRLRELDLKNLKLTLERIERVKSEIAEMYGGIEHLRRDPFAMDPTKISDLGMGGGVASGGGMMRYVAGCVRRERERLARVFITEKPPEKLAQAILDATMDDLVFKFNGPEVSLDVPPKSVAERQREQQEAGQKAAETQTKSPAPGDARR